MITNFGDKDPNGKYGAQFRAEVDRPLYWEEMDFNLSLIGEIVKGYRVLGQGVDGEMDLVNDANLVLKFYQVQSGDANLLAIDGVEVGDWVWIPGVATGAEGPQGFQGWQGFQGPQGLIGPQGVDGDAGIQGPQGDIGADGVQGFQGDLGLQGLQGNIGNDGFQGDLGPQGRIGFQGAAGTDGTQGAIGAQGFQGIAGAQGDSDAESIKTHLVVGSGTDGAIDTVEDENSVLALYQVQSTDTDLLTIEGVEIGDYVWKTTAIDSVAGTQGFQGIEGVDGAQGPQGIEGVDGTQGLQGVNGTQGFQGIEGAGAQGFQGPQGLDGTQGFQGIEGAGAQGFQGPQGLDGTQGFQGIEGAGVQGFQGPQGLDGTQGFQGIEGAGVQGPQGIEGVDGTQGLQGVNGTQGFQGIEGAGAQGFQGPQGLDGTQGFQGIEGAGAQGFQGLEGANGVQGPQGLDGTQGFQGIEGAGTQGFQGLEGANGVQGPQGLDGTQGFQGIEGAGVQGPQGLEGADGVQGPQGLEGADGVQGPQGLEGADGVQGPQGLEGADGVQGPQGLEGADGVQGPQGLEGADGVQGPQGIEGPQGRQGWQGIDGAQGTQGFQGLDGIDGAQGPQGSQGIEGIDGIQGPQGIEGTGIQGFQGPQGIQGCDGVIVSDTPPEKTCSIWADTSGLDAGEYLGNQGFQGPQGSQGWQGAEGPQGLQGPQGWQGIDGTQGSQGWQGAEGPQGLQGPQGWQGIDGTQGSQGWQGAEGPQGLQGPQGWQGIDGTQGSQGWQGAEGPQGLQGPQGWQGEKGLDGALSGRIYYFNDSTIEVSGIKQLGLIPTGGDEQTVTTLALQNSDTLIETYISEEFDFIVIPGGVQRFYLWLSKENENDNIEVFTKLYLAQNDGQTLALAGTSQAVDIGWNNNNLTAVLHEVDITFPNTAVEIGQRIKVELYARNLVNQDRSVTFYTEDAAHYSYVVTSVAPQQGFQGPQGWQGWQGIQGVQGWQGVQGPQGWQGINGTTGPQGWQGFQGVQGYQGIRGVTGNQGPQGAQGWQGFQGWQGVGGIQGVQGPQGWQGVSGAQGIQGPQGWQGIAGTAGQDGVDGFDGPQGFQGIAGISGDDGAQGIQGPQGWQGIAGTAGQDGVDGFDGPQGFQGNQGFQGTQGWQGFQGIQGLIGVQTTCETGELLPDTDIFAIFDDTGSMIDQDILDIEAAVDAWFAQYQLDNPDYTGNLYKVATNNERWLAHSTQILNNSGFGESLSPPAGFTTVLPSWWKNGSPAPITSLVLLTFVNESDPVYHEQFTTNFLTNEPTTEYIQDITNHINTYNALTYFKGVIYPVVPSTSSGWYDYSKSFLLHSLAAVKGTTQTASQIQAEFGVNYDTSTFTALESENPYETATLTPLKDLGWYGIWDKNSPVSASFTAEEFALELNDTIFNQSGEYSVISLIQGYDGQTLTLRGLKSMSHTFTLDDTGCIIVENVDGATVDVSATTLKAQFTQASHGFVVGNVVAYKLGTWYLANSDDDTLLGRAVVESVVDANTFVAVYSGLIQSPSLSLTTGAYYVVGGSSTAQQGELVEYIDETNPSFAFSNPILQALTPSSGHVLPWRPTETGNFGPQGTQGWQGPQGWQGQDGTIGVDGAQGPQGWQGQDGTIGVDGTQGPQGWQGQDGTIGVDGTQGPQGPQGPQGWQGWQGPTGPTGADGTDGTDGAQGPQGWQGPGDNIWNISGSNIYYNSGNVLIGTTTDNGARLQVSDAATVSGNVTSGGATENLFIADGNTFSGFKLNRAGTQKWSIFNNNAGTDFFDIYNYQTGLSNLVITSGGNVGIGATDPLEKLHVVGNIVATGDIGAFYSSDINLKDNLEKITGAIDKINQINGYTFDWKDGGGVNRPRRDMGVIAQEIEKIAPEVVTQRDNGYLAVKYEKMIALLIEGIKELSKEIEELKKDR